MSGIFQGDILIKTALELGIQDLRENEWLIEHMLSDLVNIKYISDQYGKKQVDACKEWLKNNQIDINMAHRTDKDRFPCVTIEMGSSSEKPEMKHLADTSNEAVILLPNKIGKPIPYIVNPFTPLSYDQASGELGIDQSITGVDNVSVGMILVNPANGNGYVITDTNGSGVSVAPGTAINASQLGIVPSHQFYKARVEHTFFQETYNIGSHSHGDPQVLLWLWSIVLYSLMRYRESLLEANGFAESVVVSSNVDLNGSFTTAGGERAWSRYVTLTGQVENTWVKSPQRYIETVALRQPATGPETDFIGGINILANLDTPPTIDESENLWNTIDDDLDDV